MGSKTARNDITHQKIKTKPANKQYADGWDRIFGKKPSKERGCNGKIKLGSLTYIAEATKLGKKHSKRYGVYNCPHCKGIHLTTNLTNSKEYAAFLFITDRLK